MTPDDLIDHLDVLYRYAIGVTHDPDVAGDVVQDTVLRALERRHQYRSDAPLRHWLLRIAHNTIVDRARRSGREIVVDDVEQSWRGDGYTVDAAMVMERAAERDELLDALARLPFIYRAVVVMHDVQELTVAEIADILEIGLPAAKQRLRRGRMAMVSALAESDRRRRTTSGVPMRCWDARQHVSDYLNGDLEAATSRKVEAHLSSCPTCPPLYAALVGVHDELSRVRDPDSVIRPELARDIQAIIER